MRILDIAFKDIRRSFRSAFGIAMMFVVPILIPGIIYFAFGGQLGGSSSGGFNVPVTRVVVANLDHSANPAAGAMLVEFLQNENLKQLLDTSVVSDEATARARVNSKQADVAVIIPADFSTGAFTGNERVNVTLYHDPTLTVGPLIVKQMLAQFVDGLSGARITLDVARQQLGTLDQAAVQNMVTQYANWAQSMGHSQSEGAHPLFELQAPPSKTANSSAANMMASITVGMLIFFAFYTGAISAQSILKEEEDGTLPRLFTTPTPRATILGGKFAAIFMMVVVQVSVVMIVSSLLFKIQWGEPLLVALAIVALVACSAGFGLFLLSFIKTTRQAGPIIGGVLTVLAMAGGWYSLLIPSLPALFDQISLFTPHGWVLRSWKVVLSGGTLSDMLLPVVVAVAIGAALFMIGTWNFRRRYA